MVAGVELLANSCQLGTDTRVEGGAARANESTDRGGTNGNSNTDLHRRKDGGNVNRKCPVRRQPWLSTNARHC